MKKLPKSLTTVTRLSKTLALIMLIVFPIVGFFLGMKYQEVKSSNVQISDSTNNWKTYINTEFNYQFSRPDNFIVTPFCGKNDELIISSGIVDCNPDPFSTNAIRIIVYDGDQLQYTLNNMNPTDLGLDKSLVKINIKNLIFNGFNAKEMILTNKQNDVLYEQILFVKNNKTYRLENNSRTNYSEEQDIFNKFLSTFKFTN